MVDLLVIVKEKFYPHFLRLYIEKFCVCYTIKESTAINLNNLNKIQSLAMYLHSSSNHKFHHGVFRWDQCLQHHVLSGVLATSKIVNIRQFNKLIKTNTCIKKWYVLKNDKCLNMTSMVVVWGLGKTTQSATPPPWEASISCKSKNCIYYKSFNMCTIWKN